MIEGPMRRLIRIDSWRPFAAAALALLSASGCPTEDPSGDDDSTVGDDEGQILGAGFDAP